MSVEQTIYETLNTLGYPVTPIGPASDDMPQVGPADGLIIEYRRKSAQYDRLLTGQIVFEDNQFEILVRGETVQQATAVAQEVKELLDNQTYDDYTFFINNAFVNDTNLKLLHQWWTIIFTGND